MTIYVNAQSKESGDGSKAHPFKTISEAARIAKAGDTVLVAKGVYREYVDPINSGKEDAPITYISEEKLGAVITGAERITNWQKLKDFANVWFCRVPNSLFARGAFVPQEANGNLCAKGTTYSAQYGKTSTNADGTADTAGTCGVGAGATIDANGAQNSFANNLHCGYYNPFTTLVEGDWLIAGTNMHTGDVFLNDKSLYEQTNLDAVINPTKSKVSWDADFSLYTWYAEQDTSTDETVIYANFGKFNPNKENAEISVRATCFQPSKTGVNYITLSGFTVCKAATQWAPPTAFQTGMVAPHWSKGWIIEDCEIYESKCSGISLGKYLQPQNDNKWLRAKLKDGTQTERENICLAQLEGWSKENIGSHIVRRCNIHHCGQTGIVGHLGGVFSRIEHNHIHHINNKQNLAGAEIGGIKMHAAIDAVIAHNHIHHCTRGLWLDWQAQGTRVTKNAFHHNVLPFDYNTTEENSGALGEDIFIEVSHGPTLVDNNLLLSEHSLKLATQGVALVHNFVAGSFTAVGVGTNNGTAIKPSPRYTPYHVPHRTEIMGFMTILHGDCRFYNNIFIQQKVRPGIQALCDAIIDSDWTTGNTITGTHPYEQYPIFDEWINQFDGYCGMGSEQSERYYNALPVWYGGNVYLNGAKPCSKEKAIIIDSAKQANFELKEKNGAWTFSTNAYDFVTDKACTVPLISTDTLGSAFESEQRFENADGNAIVFDTDFAGLARACKTVPGPFAKESATNASKQFVL